MYNIISENATIGQNTIIEYGAVISDGVVIGDNCFIGYHTIIRPNVTIGNGSTSGSSSGVTILGTGDFRQL